MFLPLCCRALQHFHLLTKVCEVCFPRHAFRSIHTDRVNLERARILPDIVWRVKPCVIGFVNHVAGIPALLQPVVGGEEQ